MGSGIIYGTTYYGGGSGCSGQGCGTVFKLVNGETVLHRFAGGTTDGCSPYGGVTRDTHGNLYGTTCYCGSSGYGTVWMLDKKGLETVHHNFTGGATDGAYPAYGNLIIDRDGNLYGATNGAGANSSGTVFKLDATGALTVLYSFTGGMDGGDPDGTLVRDSEGNLYGTTVSGGSHQSGTVWKLDPSGVETVLHSFSCAVDGCTPMAGVVRAGGNLYGVAYYGGPYGQGTVWKLTNRGVLTVLHNFGCSSGGCYPIGGLVRGSRGNLYGTAYYGGSSGYYGTVWQITP
jgi:uncharacterized repeat protein (TIGR03803 family)